MEQHAGLHSTGPSSSRAEFKHASVFAWDHARPVPSTRLSAAFKLDPERRAGVCGDFFMLGQGEGVEAAALSGKLLAESMAEVLIAAASGDKTVKSEL